VTEYIKITWKRSPSCFMVRPRCKSKHRGAVFGELEDLDVGSRLFELRRVPMRPARSRAFSSSAGGALRRSRSTVSNQNGRAVVPYEKDRGVE